MDNLPQVDNQSKTTPTPQFKLVLKPQVGLQLVDIRELWLYRDTLFFLAWRDIRVRYAQSILGIGWAIFNPLMQMLIFTAVFGNLARIDSQGAPYAVFVYAALVPWNYFANVLTRSSANIINAQNMINKVYFPRVFLPLSVLLEQVVDFLVAMGLLLVLMLIFKVTPTVWVVVMPLMMVMMIMAASGLAMLLSALAVQYRDVAYGMSTGVTLLMYCSPVIYPTKLVPEKLRVLYSLNPMVGVIEGFRAALLGTTAMPWNYIFVGSLTALLLFTAGLIYFRTRESIFADVG